MEMTKLRICGDFRSTVNRVTETESYPIPRIEYIYATLSGGTIFSQLDFNNAYRIYLTCVCVIQQSIS